MTRENLWKHNWYFGIYKKDSSGNEEVLQSIHLRLSKNESDCLYHDISSIKYGSINERYYLCDRDIKKIVIDNYTHIFSKFDWKDIDVNDSNIELRVMSESQYRELHEDYDNQLVFVEYVMSEKANIDRVTNITSNILSEAGFVKDDEDTKILESMVDDYESWSKIVNIGNDNFVKIDLSYGLTNSLNNNWNCHVDNNVYESIASIDLNTIWEFNELMDLMKIPFRL